MKRYIAILFFLLAVTSPVHAQQKQRLGAWDVHYMVVNTTFFDANVLKHYAIQRSKYSALVNISVLNSDTQVAQDVALSGQYKDLLGKVKTLNFKQVKEGDAVYYLAQFPFADKDTYRFDIQVQSGNQQQSLRFQQQLYAD